ncbi:MAG: hypothetical protein JKY26_08110 [Pseudomonas sp.]|nr:hypothetical protein [Pseudomonas sp.]
MLKDLTNFTKKPVQTKAEQLMSMGGGMLMLRKGVTRPGIIGALSLAVGAYTLYRGIKAYRASHTHEHATNNMATRPGPALAKQESASETTVPATPVKSPLG